MTIPKPLQRILHYVTYENGRFLRHEIAMMPKADQDAIDRWLVEIQHPLAYQPGTQEYRIETIARELVLGAKVG